ncbi:putative Ig domain-containing protein, partial [Winogradskyella sp. A2]|uniref:putative Ig domain-containing protein n=1 Tax=Winogradskyella sp. A2 TaxID=3366944 RepID=UPI00398C519C
MKVVKIIFVSILFSFWSNAQVNFSQSQITFNVPDDPGATVNAVTSLMYGPDGRLYVAEYTGAIKILTIQRNSATDYVVTDIEELDGILTMADHNDDGTTHNSTFRETIGLTVVGTAQNPVIYVTSSDFRIGAGDGGGNGDVNLDTNSGVITRFSWNGTSWDVVDLVRGLPRSEENHATNGLEFVTINGNDYLIVASGGHTNAGSPSTNFVYTCEYALSAAVLSVDLTALNSLPILDDNGRSYIYDLPTLDDPTRTNVNGISDPDVPGYNGIDVNDPWGGNDGLNQAIIDPNGPVQIFSPGYRNAYDLVVTESGAVYVTDNGANGGWGGFPANEGGGNATNDYDSSEPGSTSSSGGEQINNKDHLQLITTNIQNYNFGSLYGGHPNPTRANPTGAGLYTDDGTNQVFRTLIYDPSNPGIGYTDNPDIALPANWDLVVPAANPIEGDWRGPGISNPDGPNDNPVTTWGTNTNGIDEYTATNFGGIMQGNLLAGVNNGVLRRVELDGNGDLDQLTSNFLSGIGGNALGVTCNGDNEIFPGTIWAGTLNGKIVVFEPQDFVPCLDPTDESYDPLADYDNDGYTNLDEEQNFTDSCNGGSQPADFDKSSGGTLISDLNDTDDDFDGIPDSLDPFQLGDHTQSGSDAFTLPISNDLFNDQQGLGGIFGLGMTGLMNNGDSGPNWLSWIDDRDNGPNPNDVLGGAPGIMTSHMTSGTALGTINTQEKGYQYGVQVDNSTGTFTVTGGMNGFTGPLRLFENEQGITNGELGFFIGDGTQSNYIKFVVTTDGFIALQEIGDVPQTPVSFTFPLENPSISGILFHFVINNLTGEVNLEYQINGGSRTLLGTITAQGNILTALQDPSVDLAVGFIGTSGTAGLELEGSWDFLNVSPYPLIEVDPVANQNNDVNDEISPFGITAIGGNPSANFTYAISGQPEGINIDSNTGVISGTIGSNAVFGGPNNDGLHQVTVTVNKPGSTQQIINFNWTVTGPLVVTSIDDQQDQIGTTV